MDLASRPPIRGARTCPMLPGTRPTSTCPRTWSGNPLTLFDNRGGTVYGTPGSGTVENGLSRAALCPGFTYDQIETSGNVKDRLGSVSDKNVTRFFNAAAFCLPPAI